MRFLGSFFERVSVPMVAASLASGACSSGSAGSPVADASPGRDASVDHYAPPLDAHSDVLLLRDSGATDATDASFGDSSTCHATPGAADRARKVVISHPYDKSQNASGDFEVWDLSQAGTLSQPKVHFTLGPTTLGMIAFTPDGSVGLVAEDDGTLGVFRFDASGTPVVVSASLKGSYYATGVVMDPGGARAYVLDDQTVDNGGGIYTVAIACDGTLMDEGLLVPADLPAGVLPLSGGDAVVLAKNLRGVPALMDGSVAIADAGYDAWPFDAGPEAGPPPGHGNDAVLVSWPAANKVSGFADPFGDDLAIVSTGALTQDGRYALLGDNSQFSGVPNRVGIVRVTATGIAAAGIVQNVNDPETLLASPFDDTVLVTSAFGNALFVIGATGDAGVPFAMQSPLAYAGAAPQLPGPAVMISRGGLTGRVLVAENQAIRQVQFAQHGSVTDLGPTVTGNVNDFTSIVGAIGVEP
jgi:hypothetical protein